MNFPTAMFRPFARLILGLGLASSLALPSFGQTEATNPPVPGGPFPPPEPPECPDCEGSTDGGGTAGGSCGNTSHSASVDSVFFTLDLGRATFEPKIDFVSYSLYPGLTPYRQKFAAMSTGIDRGFRNYRSRPLSARRQVKMWFEQEHLADGWTDLGSLSVDRESKAEILPNTGVGRPDQVVTDDYFTDVRYLTPTVIGQLPADIQSLLSTAREGFVIRSWDRAEKGALSGGLYTLPTTDALKYVVFYNPQSLGVRGKLNIIHRAKYNATQYKTLSYRYDEDATTHDWTMTTHDGLPATNPVEEVTLDVTSWDPALNLAGTQIRTVKRVDLDATGAYGTTLKTISVTREQFDVVDGKQRLAEKTEGHGTAPRTTKYLYYDSLAEYAFRGRIKGVVHPDGSYSYFHYEYPSIHGVVIKEIKSWNDLTWDPATDPFPAGIHETTTSTSGTTTVGGVTYTTSETIVEEKAGTTLLSRRIEQWSVDSAADKLYTERKAYKERTSGGYDYTTFQECFHADNADSLRKGRLKWRSNTDGTFEKYTYQSVGGSDLHHIRTAETGEGSVSGMISGTRTVTEINRWGYAVKEEVYHFHGTTAVLLNSWISESEDFFGRPLKRIWNMAKNGHSLDFDQTTYGCCGISEFRDRNGIVTQFYRDGLKREYRQVETAGTKVITTSTAYSGRETTVRRSAGGIDLLVSSTLVRENGEAETVKTPDQDGDGVPEITSYSESYPSGGGRTQTITYPNGGTEVSQYFVDGRLRSVTGTAITDRTMDYGTHTIDGGGRWTSTTYPTAASASGHWEKNYFDMGGRFFKTEYPTQIKSPGTNDFSSVTYYPTGRVHQQTDADGVTVTYTYDGEGNLATVTEPMPGSAASRVTAYTHQGVNDTTFGGSIQETTTVNGVAVSVGTDSGDGYGSRTVSLGPTTSRVRSIGSGGAWTVTTTRPDNTYAVAAYQNGQLSLTGVYDSSNALIESTSLSYDAINRLGSSVHSRKGTSLYNSYTESGLLRSVTEPGSLTSLTKYDKMGRVVETDAPDTLDASGATIPNVTKTSYYHTGKIEAVWGDQGYPTFHAYDEQNRMLELRTYRTLAHGTRPLSSTAGADLTTWTYHVSRGWLLGKTYADGYDAGSDPDPGPAYTYTAAGRLKKQIWARGNTTRFDYDAGRLAFRRYFLASTNQATVDVSSVGNNNTTTDVSVAYDAFGRITQVANAISTIGYAYDPVTLALAAESVSVDPDGGGTRSPVSRTFVRKRDVLLRDTGYQLMDGISVDAEMTYAYDPAGRLGSVTGDDSGSFSYNYLANSGDLVSLVNGPVHNVSSTWLADRDLLDTRENEIGTTDISVYNYDVNSLGQRTGVAVSGTGFGASASIGWGYDAKGQVTTADRSGGTAGDRGYEYDGMGNRSRSSRNTTNPATAGGSNLAVYKVGTTGSSSNGANALNQYRRLALYGAAAVNQTYDEDGNQYDGVYPQGGSGTRSWDGENRLASTLVGSTTTSYRYDPFGRRVAKLQGAQTSMTGTIYFYDRWNVAAECKILATTYPLDRTYTWGKDLSGSLQGAGGVGGMLAVEIETGSDAGVYYPAYDGNGNVSEYLDASGNVVAHYEYDPFGETVNFSGTKAALFQYRFSTKLLDPETGYYYYGHRFYDPATGRWPSKDPIEENGGVNLYGFVENCGIAKFDVLGMSSDCCDKKKIADGKKALQGLFDKVETDQRTKAAASGTPVAAISYLENEDISCHGRANQVATEFNKKVPKCWGCAMINRKPGWGALVVGLVGDHWWVECKAHDHKGNLVDWIHFDLHAVMHGDGNRQDQYQDYIYPGSGKGALVIATEEEVANHAKKVADLKVNRPSPKCK